MSSVVKADKFSWFSLVIFLSFIAMAAFLGGCGNTIQGIGTDIVETGKKVTDWQNKKDERPSQESK